MSREEALVDLAGFLARRFEAWELLALIQEVPGGSELVLHLPEGPLSPLQRTRAVVQLLEQRALLDGSFMDLIQERRPALAEQVDWLEDQLRKTTTEDRDTWDRPRWWSELRGSERWSARIALSHAPRPGIQAPIVIMLLVGIVAYAFGGTLGALALAQKSIMPALLLSIPLVVGCVLIVWSSVSIIFEAVQRQVVLDWHPDRRALEVQIRSDRLPIGRRRIIAVDPDARFATFPVRGGATAALQTQWSSVSLPLAFRHQADAAFVVHRLTAAIKEGEDDGGGHDGPVGTAHEGMDAGWTDLEAPA